MTLAAPSSASPAQAPEAKPARPAIGLLILPGLGLLAIFFIAPFGLMTVLTVLSGNPLFDEEVTVTGQNWVRLGTDVFYWQTLWSTIRIGIITTLATLVIGYPIAHWMARIRSRLGHLLLLMAVITPMLTGIVVRTFAWITILSDQGVINSTLMSLGLTSAPLPLMYNEFGVIVALTHIFVPFMVLTLVGVIGRIDTRIEEAARVHGASPLRTFAEVTLPLSLPGILAGSLLVFALAISSYVTPYLLGGTDVLTLPMLIYSQIAASFNPTFAGTLGCLLLGVSLILVISYNNVLGRLSRSGGYS